MYGWYPGIGDPTFYGWLTVFAYFAASGLCLSLVRPQATGHARRFWRGLGVFLLLLGLNKQLDVQSLFTAVGRVMAEQEGWYDQRRGYQELFIAAIAASGLAGALILLALFRREGPWALTALTGAALLITFVVIRAASFHHIDLILRSGVAGFRVNHVMELGGIAVATLGALGERRRIAGHARFDRLRALAAQERARRA